MREDNYPRPVSDPESEGVPGPADDDSTARDDVQTGREADGPDPAALPADAPLAVDRYGTTPQEQLDGESLDYKLTREVPDTAVDVSSGRETPAMADDDPDALVPGGGYRDLDAVGEAATTDPATGSAVSVYDRPEWDTGGGTVGRIVEPDQGGPLDDERDAVGYDAGIAGGGPSAEELAIHEIPER